MLRLVRWYLRRRGLMVVHEAPFNEAQELFQVLYEHTWKSGFINNHQRKKVVRALDRGMTSVLHYLWEARGRGEEA